MAIVTHHLETLVELPDFGSYEPMAVTVTATAYCTPPTRSYWGAECPADLYGDFEISGVRYWVEGRECSLFRSDDLHVTDLALQDALDDADADPWP